MICTSEGRQQVFALALGITHQAESWRSMHVGDVHFKAEFTNGGSWALARPDVNLSQDGDGIVNEHLHPDFGKIRGIYMHTGPDGVERLITRMKWYNRVADMYHKSLRCPQVSTVADTRGIHVMWPAVDIVPWTCAAMPLGRSQTHQVMLARTWSVLRHLGFPSQPHLHPYPHLPAVPKPPVVRKGKGPVVPIVPIPPPIILTDDEDEDYEPESDVDDDDSETSLDNEEFDQDEFIA